MTLLQSNSFPTVRRSIHAGAASPATVEERTFTTFDGTDLFYRLWRPAEPPTDVLILLHRGHEHSGRWAETVDRLALPTTLVAAWDARGHGRSPGERGGAESFADVVRDVDCFARHVCETNGLRLQEAAVLAHSVGAVAAAAWVHDYAPPVRAMVLATPAFRVRLYVPLAMPALRLGNRVGFPRSVTSYVKSKLLTRDPAEQAAYDADPLISKRIATNVLVDMADTSDRLLKDAGAIDVPTLVLSAGRDWVVDNAAQRAFFDRLSSPVKRFESFDGFGHAIFHEAGRERVVDRVRQFLTDELPTPGGDGPVAESAHTRREHARLSTPLPSLHPKRLNFAAQRLAMKTAGRLSHGVRLGWRTGFDSGESLDHVYGDRSRGTTPLGRLIDRGYLDAVGWRGIRQRKVYLQELLRTAVDERRGENGECHVVDVASGPGRYLLELLADLPRDAAVTAALRDRSPGGLAAGRAVADDLGVTRRATFAEGDAFDRAALASLDPRPDVAVVSGLYELFDDNSMISRSLAGLADAVPPGGWLVYTNQPWHPQVEMIARVLTNRDGAAWVMRRRPQGEMDRLVAAAGFEKVTQRIDRWGIFTVSAARRV